MIIRLIFILIFLSSCDKYLGTIDKDYTPTKKLITIENNNLFNSNKEIIFPNIAKPTNFNLFNLPVGNLSSNNLNKIQKISKYDNKSNIVFFNNDIIFISNNLSVSKIQDFKVEKISSITSQYRKKNDYFLNIINHFDNLYFISNYGEIFLLDKNYETKLINSIQKNLNYLASNENYLVLLSKSGEIITYDTSKNIFNITDKININFGFNNKIYSKNRYEDILFYNVNSNTFSIIDLSNFKNINSYVIDSINILSNIGEISNMIDTPFNNGNDTVFVNSDGKLFKFNISTDQTIWEIDVNENIKDFLYFSNYLILLTNKFIYVIDLENGGLINKLSHQMKNVRLLSLVNNKLMVISDYIINFYVLQKSDLVLKRSMKSIKEVVGIGYTDGNIYIKDKKNIYILSE